MRKILSATLGLLALSAAAPAAAQEFGQQGDVSFAADRLTGVYITDDFSPDFLLSLGASPSPWSLPQTTARLGIDGFIIDHLSLGGSLAIWHYGNDDRFGRDNDRTGFMIYPRIGGAFTFTPKFGIWPRGGVSFWTFEDGDDEFDLSAEAIFFFTPVEHFGIGFGPTLDIGIAGDGDEGLVFGIVTAGVFGWL